MSEVITKWHYFIALLLCFTALALASIMAAYHLAADDKEFVLVILGAGAVNFVTFCISSGIVMLVIGDKK